MPNLKSEGKCLYCEKIFSKIAISRHLQKHLLEKVNQNKPGKSFLLKVDTNPRWGSNHYFLSLWVDGEAIMEDIDDFLRSIWLECCGHMSSFTSVKNNRGARGMWDIFEIQDLLTNGKIKKYEKLMEEANGEIPMSRKIKMVLTKDLKIEYVYDFGSSTSLQLTVLNEFPVKADKKIVLLSRNDPPEIWCEICKKEPATVLCSVCMDQEENAFCKKCAKQHVKTCSDFADYAAMPIVNSPRVGVCSYEGGTIDKQRDGVFVKR